VVGSTCTPRRRNVYHGRLRYMMDRMFTLYATLVKLGIAVKVRHSPSCVFPSLLLIRGDDSFACMSLLVLTRFYRIVK
jgi:hypothetical protein